MKRATLILMCFGMYINSNHTTRNINIKECLTHFTELFNRPQEWQDCKDQCLALGIKNLSLEESIELRLLVQEKIAVINNPTILTNTPSAICFDDNECNYNHIQSPLYKYQSVLKYILTQEEFQTTKKEVYNSAKGNISQCIALYKKIIKKHKKLLKKIDACLETYIIYQQHLEEDQFRK